MKGNWEVRGHRGLLRKLVLKVKRNIAQKA